MRQARIRVKRPVEGAGEHLSTGLAVFERSYAIVLTPAGLAVSVLTGTTRLTQEVSPVSVVCGVRFVLGISCVNGREPSGPWKGFVNATPPLLRPTEASWRSTDRGRDKRSRDRRCLPARNECSLPSCQSNEEEQVRCAWR